MTAPGRAMPTGEFFDALRLALAARLPVQLRGFETSRGRGRLLKLDYGHDEIHYEVWHHQATERLEIGLHFEGSAELNSDAHAFFRSRMVEVKRGLPRAELEPWDRGWARLYETVPASELTDRVMTWAAERLAAYITNLQPMLDQFWAGAGG